MSTLSRTTIDNGDWAARFAEKEISVEAAAAAIGPGESVFIGMMTNTPVEFARALVGRAEELKSVKLYHYLATLPWADLLPAEAARHITMFATPADRAAIASGRADYLPIGNWCEDNLQRNHPSIDTAVVTLSPPDADGYMSFGSCLWLNRHFALGARRVFAEIEESAIRTGGDNRIHISQVDRFWRRREPAPARAVRALDPEAERLSRVICKFVVDELLRDGDCIQIGTGEISGRLPLFMGGLNDVGVQTEILPSGVLDLVERGVVTGLRKEIAPGKVVASAIVASEDEIRRSHMNDAIELWDFTRSDDIRLLTKLSNFKAVNSALEVDLGGQVTAESIGTRTYSGPGGQTAFAIAASYSDGGAAITVTPSSSIVGGERKSRIVPTLKQGSAITVPRTHVDFVVTEFGVAKISGCTLSERADNLINVAHPDFREELRTQFLKMYV